ncbi:MAG: hypothetical protein HDS66_07495 [Bacteroidales bacterium]|nr:hypothetical protein [Bacteroidales bacterium]
MKKTFISLSILVAATLGAAAQSVTPAARQMPKLPQGVGPVMEASMVTTDLPAQAQNFLNKYFAGVAVKSAKNDFKDRRYEVKLADGAEVEFDYNGNWIEVEAPDGATLPSSTISALMPESVVVNSLSGDAMVNGGVMQYVEEVVSYPDFYVVSAVTPDGTKTRASVDRKDGKVNVLKQKAPKDKRGHKGAHGRKGGRRAGYDSTVMVRLDHNPRFY